MEYPTSVHIKGYDYRIEYVPTSQEVVVDFEAGDWLGQCTNDVIRVFTGQESFGILDTLLHEILHAIFARNPMLKASLKDDNMEEPFVNTFAVELANLLVQNGWVDSTAKVPEITRRILE